MNDIDDKFDKYEKVIERSSKLILKIVTTLAALVGGIIFAWNQLHDSLDIRHVHEEDVIFQEYLKGVESLDMYENVVDSAYEDSLYKAFYHVDTIQPVIDTVVPVIDTVVPVVSVPVPVVTIPVIDTVVPVIDTVVPVIDTVIPVIDTVIPVIDTIPTDTSVVDTIVPVIDTIPTDTSVVDTLN